MHSTMYRDSTDVTDLAVCVHSLPCLALMTSFFCVISSYILGTEEGEFLQICYG